MLKKLYLLPKSSQKEDYRPRSLQCRFYHTFKGEKKKKDQSFVYLIRTQERKEVFPNSFIVCPEYQNLTKILHNIEKREREERREREGGRWGGGRGKNYRPMHLMNIDEKYLLANQIQRYIKWIIHYNQIGYTKVSLTFKMNVKKIKVIHKKLK